MTLPLEYRKITAPYYRVPVFEYWGDIYESIFCYLKPFLKVKEGSIILDSIDDPGVYFIINCLLNTAFP